MLVVSLVLLLPSRLVSERLGRKKSVLLGTAVMSVGTLLQSTFYSLPQIIVGRIVLGYVCHSILILSDH